MRHRCSQCVVWLCLVAAPLVACAGQEVDPVLVGRWQLQGAPQPVYWEIRANGTYTIEGPGAGSGHAGSFTATHGRWTLHSVVWGDDGGAYQLSDPNTFVGNGRLGGATWRRLTPAPTPEVAQSAPATRTVATGGPLRLATQVDAGLPLPSNVPELLARADQEAHRWRADAAAVIVEFEQRDAPNPSMRGPQIRIAYRSPSDETGRWVYVTPTEARSVEVRQRTNWGQFSVPPAFIDLPVAVRKAREHGMQGPVSTANLRVWTPAGKAIAVWMIAVKGGRGRTIDATTGSVIEGDVTGYIASYNAQMDRAAAALRALMRRGASHGSHVAIGADGTPMPAGSETPYDDGSAGRAEYERDAAEARAYWQYDAADYNRIKNGECTWSDSSNIGC